MGVHCRIWSNEWAERKDFWDEPDSLAFCRGVHGGIRGDLNVGSYAAFSLSYRR